jgi:hypothetical protein
LLAGQEHGRTIPLTDLRGRRAPASVSAYLTRLSAQLVAS